MFVESDKYTTSNNKNQHTTLLQCTQEELISGWKFVGSPSLKQTGLFKSYTLNLPRGVIQKNFHLYLTIISGICTICLHLFVTKVSIEKVCAKAVATKPVFV